MAFVLLPSRPRLLGPALALGLVSAGCLMDNPAFEFDDELGDGDGDSGDGDPTTGDPTTGDPTTGDPTTGDPTTGDGDGDPTTGDGDGDGDPTTGDGDGDPTTGDGDGDSGDGDGDATGDGDGDPNPNLCEPPEPANEYFPFETQSLGGLSTDAAPSFASAPENCLLMMVCAASQGNCDPETSYVAKIYSNGQEYVGESLPESEGLQIRFHPGGGACEGASLALTPNEYFGLVYWTGQAFAELKARMPCLEQYDVPVFVAHDGSTFWDPDLSQPAALW